ncbi:hypothetical protein HS088_TW13G00189 [Tripterygium wilfordii]|uniref:Uncharacterized protein n=1 Tax=Tripterygium wilfordii TaxID=458696 RepID=A0A7J7CT97_TRIWF|nr:uncharacterized protein LOC120011891 [Tripterygium wilfordii]KAF5737310.1 hypothetical protein HS088_TW13G00189 [Tripterygium wilfordii]
MGLLRSLAMPFLLILLSWLPEIRSQSNNRAEDLGPLLQDYAFRAFVRPKTGVPYDGVAPSNLTGIKVAVMRLRSGSLKRRGVLMYKEFEIPPGVMESQYVKRLVLVYHNLGNWSTIYYPLTGYSYLTPVLGLVAYSATNLSATNLPELEIRATGDPIKIKFPEVRSAPDGLVARCVWYDRHGLANFSSVLSGNACSTTQQGHFAIVVESVAPPPAPIPPSGGGPAPSGEGKKKKTNSRIWIIVGSVLGGLALLLLLAFLLLWMRKYKHKRRMQKMENAAEVGETLRMTTIGDTKAPSAMLTRTQPTLESEYVL